jgi:putative DNA primase/helicase
MRADEGKGELHGLCPFHNEKNPSFSYNYNKDVYNCFSCPAEGDLVSLWSHVKGFDEKEGFKAFCTAYGLDRDAKGSTRKDHQPKDDSGKRKATKTKVPDLDALLEKLPPLPETKIKDLEKTRGWSRRMIEILDLRLQTHYYNKKGEIKEAKPAERIAIPVRDQAGKLVNVRLYKPGASEGKMISAATGTGEARLFPALPMLPDDPVVVCEGEPDTICALSLGINVVTQTAKKHTWPDEHLEPFRGRDVVVAYDADQPGQEYAAQAASCLLKVAKSVRLLQWPDYMGRLEDGTWPAKGGQDLTDFFVRHGKTIDDFKALLAAAKSWTEEDASLPENNDKEQFFSKGVNGRESFKPRLLAEKILQGLSLLSDPDTGLLYRWNGKHFEIFADDHLRNLAIRFLGDESQKSRVEDAVYQARVLCTIPHGRSVNDRTDWLPVQNGMLNMCDYELVPHDQDFFNTYVLPVSFKSHDTTACVRWLKYLEQTVQTPEVILQVQEFFGYCLTRNADYEKCLFLLGPGEDGKSKMIHVLREMVGPENCSAVAFASLENEFHRSSLYNKLVNISTEIGGNYIESPYFKAITSGDPIDGAFKHQNSFQFLPFCKLLFAGNLLPRVKDTTHGYYRRLLPIKFKRQFFVGDTDRDPHLLDVLKKELSDIFVWSLAGLMRLKKQKAFTNCEETEEIMRGYKRSNNPVQCFAEDELEFVDDQDRTLKKAEIYQQYRDYCKDNGYSPLSNENLFRELYSVCGQLRKRQRQERNKETGKAERVFSGVKWRPPDTPDGNAQ